MAMYVKVRQMIFDETDPMCKCIVSKTHGVLFAFVQCIDTGMNEDMRIPKRYWGPYSYENPEEMMADILNNGGKWPRLPGVEPLDD